MKRAFVLIAAIITLALAGCSRQTAFTSADGTFGFMYSSRLQPTQRTVAAEDPLLAGPISMNIVEMRNDSIVCTVVYWDYPEEFAQKLDPAKFLEDVVRIDTTPAKDAKEQVATVAWQVQNISIDGFPGKEAVAGASDATPQLKTINRYYLVKQRMYKLVASGLLKYNEDMTKFLSSFKLLKK